MSTTLYVVDGLGPAPVETVLTGVRQKDGDIIAADDALRARVEKQRPTFGPLSSAAARAVERHDLTPGSAAELGVDGLLQLDGIGKATAEAILEAATVGEVIVIPWLRHATEADLIAAGLVQQHDSDGGDPAATTTTDEPPAEPGEEN